MNCHLMCIAQITCYLLPVASQETEQKVGISSTSWETAWEAAELFVKFSTLLMLWLFIVLIVWLGFFFFFFN